jgi:hypothetical protein
MADNLNIDNALSICDLARILHFDGLAEILNPTFVFLVVGL